MAHNPTESPTESWSASNPSGPLPREMMAADDQRSEETMQPATPNPGLIHPNEQAPRPPCPAASSTEQVDLVSDTEDSAPPPTRQSLWKLWALELAAIVFSLISFIVIVVILSTYDDRGLPDWPLGITLNTFLAFFTILAQGGFMLPVSTAIGQAKWTWFLKKRPLYDFDLFSQASSGLWGPLVLLWKVHRRHFISIAAFLMVISTVTSPITQLTIKYPLRNTVTSGEAKSWALQSINSTDDLNSAAQLAATLATATDETAYKEPIEPSGASCSTGNCTFEPYRSLGICVKTANITSLLQVNEIERLNLSRVSVSDNLPAYLIEGKKTWNVSLPGGYPIMHQNALLLYTDFLNGSYSIGFKNNTDLLETRIASIASIYTTPTIPKGANPENTTSDEVKRVLSLDGGFRYEAKETLFHLCVQTLNTSVKLGDEATRLASSHSKPVTKGKITYLDLNCSSPFFNDISGCSYNKEDSTHVYLPASAEDSRSLKELPEDEIFSSDYASMGTIGQALQSKLAGGVLVRYADGDFSDASLYSTQQDFITNMLTVIYEMESIRNLTERNVRLTNLFANVATSLSSLLRNGDRHFAKNSHVVSGEALQLESYVHIDWEWISFIAVELVLATSLLAVTIATQAANSGKREHTAIRGLKDAPLATLVVLGDEARAMTGGGLTTTDELKKRAKGVVVKLEGNLLVLVPENEKSRTTTFRSESES